MKIRGDGEKEEEGEISSTTSTSDKGEDVLTKFQFNSLALAGGLPHLVDS